MNYYEELGLTKNASEKDIKQAFRKLAKENHPDKTNGDKAKEEKFKRINEANQVLSDPEKKAEYDAMLASGYNNKNFHEYSRSGTGQRGGQNNFSEEDFANIFGSHFYSSFFSDDARKAYGPKQRKSSYSPSLNLNISFIDAIKGCTKVVYVPEEVIPGKIKTNIKIPPGADNGDEFSITVKGKTFTISLKVTNNTEYQRNGLDLYKDVNVPLTTTILGSDFKFNHLGKDLEVHIPSGTQSQSKLRLKNLGVEKNGVNGNLILKINTIMPQNLTEKQKKLLSEFAKIEDSKNK